MEKTLRISEVKQELFVAYDYNYSYAALVIRGNGEVLILRGKDAIAKKALEYGVKLNKAKEDLETNVKYIAVANNLSNLIKSIDF